MMQNLYRAIMSPYSTASARNVTARTRERGAGQNGGIRATADDRSQEADAASQSSRHDRFETLRMEAEVATRARTEDDDGLHGQWMTEADQQLAKGAASPESQRGSPSSPHPPQPTLVEVLLQLDERHRAEIQAAAVREERLIAALASRPTSPRPPSSRASSPQQATADLVTTMLTLFDAQRRTERQDAIERENQTLERMEARHQAQWAAVQAGRQPAAGRYVVGTALASTVTKFTGDGAESWDEWLRGFDRMARAHNIPESAWPNELVIKLSGLAGRFVETRFPVEGPQPTPVGPFDGSSATPVRPPIRGRGGMARPQYGHPPAQRKGDQSRPAGSGAHVRAHGPRGS